MSGRLMRFAISVLYTIGWSVPAHVRIHCGAQSVKKNAATGPA